MSQPRAKTAENAGNRAALWESLLIDNKEN
jgi:hypothetical protein